MKLAIGNNYVDRPGGKRTGTMTGKRILDKVLVRVFLILMSLTF